MDWQLLIAVGITVFLWRDVCLLSAARSVLSPVYGTVQIAAFLLLGIFAETISRDEAFRLLRDPRLWIPAVVLHLVLWAVLFYGQRRQRDWVRQLAMFPNPIFLFSAGGLVWLILRTGISRDGWVAGLLAAAAWITAVLALAAVKKHFAPSTFPTSVSFAATSNLTAILLVPLEQSGSTGDAMNVNTIHDLLYFLSNLFLLPTLFGTLAAFAYGTYAVGQFLSELTDHRANRKLLRDLFSGPPTEARFREKPWRGHFAGFRNAREKHAEFPAMLDKHVSELEHRLTGRIERLGIMAKVGPMLGLIGTLIPLQPALAGLARGDMQAMGANLQIGFTTTVLGLIAGGTCYAISVFLRHWYQQDLTDIHFLNALWAEPDGSLSDASLQSPPTAAVQPNGDGLAQGREAFRRAQR
ncbi:MAG: MotA/TolQ/ExbB proton channel family protein [Acidobacteria bacterium]|nr:MotA/TolQ/ExbB proton channel family protein [Acidobacteriota bacterium]